jgi:hypothetical protein
LNWFLPHKPWSCLPKIIVTQKSSEFQNIWWIRRNYPPVAIKIIEFFLNRPKVVLELPAKILRKYFVISNSFFKFFHPTWRIYIICRDCNFN